MLVLMVLEFIDFENVAVMVTFVATCVALFVGTVDTTRGKRFAFSGAASGINCSNFTGGQRTIVDGNFIQQAAEWSFRLGIVQFSRVRSLSARRQNLYPSQLTPRLHKTSRSNRRV